jgi:hypothetical protein
LILGDVEGAKNRCRKIHVFQKICTLRLLAKIRLMNFRTTLAHEIYTDTPFPPK